MSTKLRKNSPTPYLLISPGLILLGGIIFIPFIRNVLYSFTDYSLLNPDYENVQLENYANILEHGDFTSALGTTFIWSFLNIIFMLLFGLLSAFLLNSRTIKGKTLFQIFLLFPWVLPEVVTGYTWKLLLNYQTGPYYKLAEMLHLIEPGADIFADGWSAIFAVVLANAWRSFPIVAITVYAKLQTLSYDQVEAAVIDGASRFKIFTAIELPHASGTIISILSLCFIWTFNAFGIIHVMTGGGPVGATETLPLFLQKTAFAFYEYAEASAFAVLMILVLISALIIFTLLKKLIVKSKERG